MPLFAHHPSVTPLPLRHPPCDARLFLSPARGGDHRQGRLAHPPDPAGVRGEHHDRRGDARIQRPDHHDHRRAGADPERAVPAPDEVHTTHAARSTRCLHHRRSTRCSPAIRAGSNGTDIDAPTHRTVSVSEFQSIV